MAGQCVKLVAGQTSRAAMSNHTRRLIRHDINRIRNLYLQFHNSAHSLAHSLLYRLPFHPGYAAPPIHSPIPARTTILFTHHVKLCSANCHSEIGQFVSRFIILTVTTRDYHQTSCNASRQHELKQSSLGDNNRIFLPCPKLGHMEVF